MIRAINNPTPNRSAEHEALYVVDPRTGAPLEIFYADAALARSFGTRAGWHWWSRPTDPPAGPFATPYAAYRDVAARWGEAVTFGRRSVRAATRPLRVQRLRAAESWR